MKSNETGCAELPTREEYKNNHPIPLLLFYVALFFSLRKMGIIKVNYLEKGHNSDAES